MGWPDGAARSSVGAAGSMHLAPLLHALLATASHTLCPLPDLLPQGDVESAYQAAKRQRVQKQEAAWVEVSQALAARRSFLFISTAYIIILLSVE